LSNSKSKSCPKCGKIQEEESIFCGSCGADLSRKSEVRTIDNRTLSNRPLENEEFSRKNTKSKKIGRFTPGSQDSGDFDKSTFDAATYTPSHENAKKALIAGVFGLFLFLFFVPTYLGFQFLKVAEHDNEDRVMISVAKIILWLQLIVWLGAIFVGALYALFTLIL